jgi:cyclophilin family peptidyl-prolyl cis-trans isomerase
MRRLLVALIVAGSAAGAQSHERADTALIARILTAEDRRDTTAAAYADGLASPDARVQLIARRALARARDPKLAARDSLGALPAPPAYSEPAWRLRFRALDPKKLDCALVRAAFTDSAWHVRLRAADLATPACVDDAALTTLRSWLSTARQRTRTAQGAAWQPAAHALVALARLSPADARNVLPAFAANDAHWVRVYAARAAAVLADTQVLRRLARDANDNVKEAAIDALSKLTGHADDALYLAALDAKGYQAVRAGARALKGAPVTEAGRRALLATAFRLRRDSSETSRDARTEVMARMIPFADRSITADATALAADFDCTISKSAAVLASTLGTETAPRCTPFARVLPVDAVRLALGADVRLRVVMAATSGGGSFVVRLRGDVAPIMAARILALARTHYYDGYAWHRVEPDFVIQGPSRGDNEYVGHPRFLRDELGGVSHVRGTVGMSTRGHDTGDAQWFVNLRENLWLNAEYTVFGEIIEGIETADGVLEGDVIQRIEVVTKR